MPDICSPALKQVVAELATIEGKAIDNKKIDPNAVNFNIFINKSYKNLSTIAN